MSNELIETIYQDDDLIVQAEIIEGNPYLHCTILEFKKSTMKRSKRVWEDIKAGFYYEGFNTIYSVSPNPRFIKFIGGALVKQLDEKVGVYKWELV
tara:strand:- start:9098 stop:9385 length:288 start_codon:yes stop_codon:yes gene_type:complete